MRSLRACLCFCVLSAPMVAQVHLELHSIPGNTPANDPIYVAGNFNTWNPGSPAHQMILDTAAGVYRLSVTTALDSLKFKFTRGSWATVEGNASGQFLPNRIHLNVPGDTLVLNIATWEGSVPVSTASAQVSRILSFSMPPLNRSRRIWIWLPADYATSTARYPVLYMHDGQNLFDLYTSFAGEWAVDEALELREQSGLSVPIAVGIDNGGAYRASEYSAWNWSYGNQNIQAEGDLYLDFIEQYLMPYIDSNYRSLTGPEHTGIMGSSLGALISSYAAARRPDLWGKVGLFSPAYWANPQIFPYVQSAGLGAVAQRFYLIAGQGEGGGSVAAEVQQMVQSLSLAGHSPNQVSSTVHIDGEHKEWYWKREFGAAYDWLFSSAAALPEAKASAPVVWFDSRASEWVVDPKSAWKTWSISDMRGRQLAQSARDSDRSGAVFRIEAERLVSGCYVLSMTDGEGRVSAVKLAR